MPANKLKLLFVCSRNRRRSSTAEQIFARSERFVARSRGLSFNAVHLLSTADLHWADVIFVMELDQKRQILKMHPEAVGHRPIHVMDIPDEYPFMDPELIDLIVSGVRARLGSA
jgi:predicted protein tyrosine phosphatase